MDRDDTIRRAEKSLRQGKLDAAIDDYVSLVEANPRDWATANLLGDLFIRVGRVDRAVAQYARIAEQLSSDGFLSKAAALYKKILKIVPDDERALLRMAELSAQQGMVADARHALHTLYQRRVAAGDRAGAVEMAHRLGRLDPKDVVGRLDAARLLAEIGESAASAGQLRDAGDTLIALGRDADALRAWREAMRLNPADTQAQERVTNALVCQGDLDGALASAQSGAERRLIAQAMLNAGRDDAGLMLLGRVLEAEPGHVETRLQLSRMLIARQQFEKARSLLAGWASPADPRMALALAEADLRAGHTAAAVEVLADLLREQPAAGPQVAALGSALAAAMPDAGFAAVECAVAVATADADPDVAVKLLQTFIQAVPRYVPALARLAQVCRTAINDDVLYQVESELTDAYLSQSRYAEALSVAKRLAGVRPDVERHDAQMREALEGLGQAETAPPPATGPNSAALDAFELLGLAASLGLTVEHVAVPDPDPEPNPDPDPNPDPEPDPDFELESAPAPEQVPEVHRAMIRVPDSAVRPPDQAFAVSESAPADALPSPTVDRIIEIELADALEALVAGESGSTSPAAAAGDGELDDVFRRMRDESGRIQAEADAMRQYDEAGVHYNEGRLDDAVACLMRAGRDPLLRFRATLMLARIAMQRGDLAEALSWFEGASESVAPSVQAELSVLYDLGDALVQADEPLRAHAVFLELNTKAPGYRDVADRLTALTARSACEPKMTEGQA
jgi:tetratricopeptide (TPR) repeat protein